MSVPWKPVPIVAAVVIVVGGAILLATQLGSSPAPSAARSPSPHPSSAPASPTLPASPAITPPASPTGPPASPEASPTHAPTPGHTPATPSPAATLPAGLVAGAYGFPYPSGWIPGPLVTRNSLVQTETVTAPSGVGRIDYMKESSTAIYNPDHTANDTYIETAVEAAFPCNVIVAVTPEPNVG
ncbi:MAG TPA: hypothetical protein VKY26_05470, partial [Actinomycetota bacterium]|nr:hypothetical protein [Actinomycetota bacterium]